MPSRRSFLAASSALAVLSAVPVLSAFPAFGQEEEPDANPADLAVEGPIKDLPLGDAKAQVTVYEYASMTCPHCANFQKEVFPEIKSKYIDTGKVRWIIREYPLDPRATAGFMLARCAGDDKYHAMIDVLFAQQANWAFVDAAQVLPGLTTIAKQAGFTQERFDQCLKDKTLYDGVMAVKDRGSSKFNITGTPTFFINGKRRSGELSFDDFEKIVDPMLKS